jgi:hypothetical protein
MELRNYHMPFKSVWLAGLLTLGAFTVSAQTYWSTDSNLACGAYGDANGKPLQLESGAYVCYVYGTLPWYATGGGWNSSIRVAAPSTAPVAYFLEFGGVNGSVATMDFRYEGDSTVYTGSTASSALNANQPLEVDLLGLHSQAPNYGPAANGPVVVLAECPDANTCSQVQAQLLYSALPGNPWSLSVPVTWDSQTSQVWSTVGVDDGAANLVSFVIYNLDSTDQAAHTYTLNVYDSTGNLFGTATTPFVPLYGSYAALLRDVVTSIPPGGFKLQLVGTTQAVFEALQFHGVSAATLVATPEVIPSTTVTSAARGRNRRLAPEALEVSPPRILQ